MLRRLSIILAILLPAFFIAGATANAAPAARVAVPRVNVSADDLCDEGSFADLCLRDPSDGGEGTPVLITTPGSSNAEDWKILRDTGRCANAIVTSSCPGGFVSSVDQGLTLVVLQNVGQGTLCIRAAADTQYDAQMGPCDSGQEISSAFVEVSSGASASFLSVDVSNAIGTFEYLAGEDAANNDNSQAFISPVDGSGNTGWAVQFS